MFDNFHSGWWCKVLSYKSKAAHGNKCIELDNTTILVLTKFK